MSLVPVTVRMNWTTLPKAVGLPGDAELQAEAGKSEKAEDAARPGPSEAV